MELASYPLRAPGKVGQAKLSLSSKSVKSLDRPLLLSGPPGAVCNDLGSAVCSGQRRARDAVSGTRPSLELLQRRPRPSQATRREVVAAGLSHGAEAGRRGRVRRRSFGVSCPRGSAPSWPPKGARRRSPPAETEHCCRRGAQGCCSRGRRRLYCRDAAPPFLPFSQQQEGRKKFQERC